MRKKLQIGVFFYDLHFLQMFRRKLYDKGVGKSIESIKIFLHFRLKYTNELSSR